MFLIVHGWATDSTVMEHFAGLLASESGSEAVSVNLPDYTAQPKSGITADYPSMLAEIINQNIPDGKNFALIGWSMGAMIALEYAAARPDSRIDSLVLISGCGKFINGPGYPDGVVKGNLRLMKRGLKRNPVQILDNFYNDIFSDNEAGERENFLRDFAVRYHQFSPEQLVLGLEYLENTNLLDRLANLVLPVLLIHGTEDRIIRHTLADILKGRLPVARSVKLDGAGHAPFLSHPDKTTEAIIEFRTEK